MRTNFKKYGFVFLVLALLVLFIFNLRANADTLYLKNGRNIKGLIKSEDAENVNLEVNSGTVKFSKKQIERIVRSTPEEAESIRQGWEKKKKEYEERTKEAEEKKEHEPKQVNVDNKSGHIMVEATLNKKVKATLILDTGASFVVLSSNIAKQLDLDVQSTETKILQMILADGRKVDAKMFVLKSIRVQDSEVENVEVAVLPEKESDAISKDGLLGMSFLKNFNFKIDQKNDKLVLEKL
jgi:clan AA aspartic protease (TIGR02281 family)